MWLLRVMRVRRGFIVMERINTNSKGKYIQADIAIYFMDSRCESLRVRRCSIYDMDGEDIYIQIPREHRIYPSQYRYTFWMGDVRV